MYLVVSARAQTKHGKSRFTLSLSAFVVLANPALPKHRKFETHRSLGIYRIQKVLIMIKLTLVKCIIIPKTTTNQFVKPFKFTPCTKIMNMLYNFADIESMQCTIHSL